MKEALTHLAGWLAIALLVASLALSLASRGQGAWARDHRTRLLSGRRLAGLGAAGAALLHALFAFVLLEPASVTEALAFASSLPYLRHGALALALLAALALTSFPKLNARLGLRTWSTLHRGVYVAVVLAVLHVIAGPSVDPRLALAIAAIVLVVLLVRLVPRPRARGASDDEPGDQPPGLDATK